MTFNRRDMVIACSFYLLGALTIIGYFLFMIMVVGR